MPSVSSNPYNQPEYILSDAKSKDTEKSCCQRCVGAAIAAIGAVGWFLISTPAKAIKDTVAEAANAVGVKEGARTSGIVIGNGYIAETAREESLAYSREYRLNCPYGITQDPICTKDPIAGWIFTAMGIAAVCFALYALNRSLRDDKNEQKA